MMKIESTRLTDAEDSGTPVYIETAGEDDELLVLSYGLPYAEQDEDDGQYVILTPRETDRLVRATRGWLDTEPF